MMWWKCKNSALLMVLFCLMWWIGCGGDDGEVSDVGEPTVEDVGTDDVGAPDVGVDAGDVEEDVAVGEACGEGFCAVDEACYNGVCYPGCDLQADCDDSSRCFADTHCAPVDCEGVQCGELEACYRGICYPSCDLQADCDSEARCFEDACVDRDCDQMNCLAGEACYEGICYPSCSLDGDCDGAALVCDSSVCLEPTCDDGLRSGDQTDVDCGGDVCEPCPLGGGCMIDEDCAEGVCSIEQCIPVDEALPGAPTGVVAEAGEAMIALQWERPADEGTAALTGFVIEYDSSMDFGDPQEVIVDVAEESAELTEVEAGTEYWIRVRAENPYGVSPPSEPPVAATPYTLPGAPTDLQAAPADRQILLSWEHDDDGGQPATEFVVETTREPNFVVGISSVTVGPQNEATVENLDNGETYYFRVQAINDAGEGPYSEIISAVPAGPTGPPRNLEAVAWDGEVSLQWDPPFDDGGAPLTEYRVTIVDPDTLEITTASVLTGSTQTSFEMTNVVNGVDYRFAVQGVNAAGPGEYSEPSEVVRPSAPFITKWDTTVDSGEVIVLQLSESGNYHFVVDWGDGTQDLITEWDQSEKFHEYDEPGAYTVSITGTLEGWRTMSRSQARNLVEISQWGELPLDAENDHFRDTTNLKITATDRPNLRDTTSLLRAFDNSAVDTIPNIGQWDISSVETMESMFNGSNFNGDLSGWDTSNVTNMARMFNNASSFDRDISGWDVSSVETMQRMFFGASSFDRDISGWDVSSVETMEGMFNSASSFNQDISGWDVSSVETMREMFRSASSFNGDLSGWDTSQVTDFRDMFRSANSFNGGMEDWVIGADATVSNMFYNATSFNADINSWDVSGATSLASLFANAPTFNRDLNQWETSAVEDMNRIFLNATNFNGDISTWDMGNVRNLTSAFFGATSFDGAIGGWDTSQVREMEGMFRGAVAFNKDLSDWDVRRVTSMRSMFRDATAFNGDLSGWEPYAVTTMREMFQDAASFDRDIGDWPLEAVTDMHSMFRRASSFDRDIGGWNVSSVTNMTRMFSGASVFDQDLGGWDVSGVTGFGFMFVGVLLSTPNYDSLLIGWAAQDVVTNRSFHAGNSRYSAAAVEARAVLTQDKGWSITDSGLVQ